MIWKKLARTLRFQSTPSVGRATASVRTARTMVTFQSTPSVGRATSDAATKRYTHIISIHALRGEGDSSSVAPSKSANIFQSTPSVGRATLRYSTKLFSSLFQSTPSVGRATRKPRRLGNQSFISIHALRGEGDSVRLYLSICIFISIHALRGEGDLLQQIYCRNEEISIHALRGEGDCKNIQICNAMLVHSAYKTVYFCNSCVLFDLNSCKSTAFSVRTYGIFYDRCRFALKHKESFRLISGLGSDMLYFCLIVVPEIIKSQTVLFGVDELFELVFY